MYICSCLHIHIRRIFTDMPLYLYTFIHQLYMRASTPRKIEHAPYKLECERNQQILFQGIPTIVNCQRCLRTWASIQQSAAKMVFVDPEVLGSFAVAKWYTQPPKPVKPAAETSQQRKVVRDLSFLFDHPGARFFFLTASASGIIKFRPMGPWGIRQAFRATNLCTIFASGT